MPDFECCTYSTAAVSLSSASKPKDSVSKIKEVRPLWNKYLEDNGTLPDCKTADEFLVGKLFYIRIAQRFIIFTAVCFVQSEPYKIRPMIYIVYRVINRFKKAGSIYKLRFIAQQVGEQNPAKTRNYGQIMFLKDLLECSLVDDGKTDDGNDYEFATVEPGGDFACEPVVKYKNRAFIFHWNEYVVERLNPNSDSASSSIFA